MAEDFTIHLVSNVSPGVFPNNNPAEFSTLLAHEIQLSKGNWEVAVQAIMYPTHVATTSKDDLVTIHKYADSYRKLLALPPNDSVIDVNSVKNS